MATVTRGLIQGTGGHVSIVILNYNGGDHTLECLRSIEALSDRRAVAEVIVVDNASTDGSDEKIRSAFPEVRLIRNAENLGFSRGANIGAKLAAGEFVAFLNNDMRVDPSWLRPLLDVMRDPAIACVGSVVRTWDGDAVEFGGRTGDAFAISFSAATDAPPEMAPEDGETFFVSGGAMLVRASVFRALGGFEPAFFMYQEDVDFCWRSWLAGFKCRLVASSSVFHRGGASSRLLAPQIVQGMSQANVLGTVFKNLDDEGVRLWLPLLILYLHMRSSDQVEGREGFDRAVAEFCERLPAIVASRAAAQSQRVRTDDEIWALAGHPFAFLVAHRSMTGLRRALGSLDVPLDDPAALRTAVREWADRAHRMIEENGLLELERERQKRMRHLESSARDSVIRQREDGIEFLQQTLRERESELGRIRRAGESGDDPDEKGTKDALELHMGEGSEVEVALLRQQVEALSNRTRDYDAYVQFANLVADIADELGVTNLRYDPRDHQAPAISTNQSLTSLAPAGGRYDIICFSIIDWEFRWQRPQQLMSQFADHGHRVFYVSIARHLPIEGERCRAQALRDNVWEIQLAVPERVDVYGGKLPADLASVIVEDLRALRNTFRITDAVSIVQVATWAAVAYRTRDVFGWPVVYDCMDEWDTFPGMSEALLVTERRLIRDADLLVVTARKLYEKYESDARSIILARNGADFDRFHAAGPNSILEDLPHPIVGYFGAIADWFDLDLMLQVARERPKYSFVLIGGVFGLDTRDLEDLKNVHVLGQQPYEKMPEYLRNFDACIIPFKVNAVTEATDPVKFYEFISQGKPVVSTTMPELYPYADLLYIASDAEEFISMIDAALRENDPGLVERRIEVARANTWSARYESIVEALARVTPRLSIVIVTFNNLSFTRQCLESVFTRTLHPNFEVIVVDNASSDGTRDYLEELRDEHPNLRLIFNDENFGFARANNQGLAAASGDYLVLLNNDTVVPRGWTNGLLRPLRQKDIGLVNSVTNFSGNESRIDVSYSDMFGMEEFAARYTAEHFGEIFDIRVAAMYCVAMRRDTYETIGPLDERFGVGMFEDDDYSHRMRIAGYRVVCAEDSFVHHFGQASFKKLDPKEYQKTWDANQTYFQKKWNMEWRPHQPRRTSAKRSELPERAAIQLLFTNMARSRELRDVIARKDADIAHVQGELAAERAHVQALKYLLQLEQQKLEDIHSSRMWKLAEKYWKLTHLLKGNRPDGTPPLTPDSFAPPTPPAIEAPPASVGSGALEVVEPPAKVSPVDVRAAIAPVPAVVVPFRPEPRNRYDVVCFPIIEWDFRKQRPQQMMQQFAAAGHRVFYVSHKIRLKGAPFESREVSPGVFEVSFLGSPRDVYVQSMTQKDATTLAEGFEALRREFGIAVAAVIVQLPFWTPLALRLRETFAWPVVYDLMDNLAAFSTSPASILEVEEKLITSADLVAASSVSLEKNAQAKNSNVMLVRNACDYDHFASVSIESPFHTKKGRPLIGYYGAIADWFDADLVAELARRHPEWDFVLIGSTVSSNVQRLRRLRNISLAGERRYADLPLWLERFDVAIIPFRITPLTEATNPVKAYEMLAAGKPVVSVPMPEVAAMAPMVRLASTVEEFETEIRQAIEFDYEPWIVEKRRSFARLNTWKSRYESLDSRIRQTFGKALIVVDVSPEPSSAGKVVEGLLADSLWPTVEVVVLRADETDDLSRYSSKERSIHVRSLSGLPGSPNPDIRNLLADSDAEYFVLLSRRTDLPGGWLPEVISRLNGEDREGVITLQGREPDESARGFAFRSEVLDQVETLFENSSLFPAPAAALNESQEVPG